MEKQYKYRSDVTFQEQVHTTRFTTAEENGSFREPEGSGWYVRNSALDDKIEQRDHKITFTRARRTRIHQTNKEVSESKTENTRLRCKQEKEQKREKDYRTKNNKLSSASTQIGRHCTHVLHLSSIRVDSCPSLITPLLPPRIKNNLKSHSTTYPRYPHTALCFSSHLRR